MEALLLKYIGTFLEKACGVYNAPLIIIGVLILWIVHKCDKSIALKNEKQDNKIENLEVGFSEIKKDVVCIKDDVNDIKIKLNEKYERFIYAEEESKKEDGKEKRAASS